MADIRRVVVGVTGASGAAYARRLVECLVHASTEVHLVCSPHGRQLFRDELDIQQVSAKSLLGRDSDQFYQHQYRDMASVLASGSFLTSGMVVCPASCNTLGAIAAGMGDNLISRAAAVTLKERRRLVVVPREMPWSRIELENALRITDAGGIVCPASPGFYMKPQAVEDLVDFVVGKLLDLFDVPHDLNTRWTGGADTRGPTS